MQKPFEILQNSFINVKGQVCHNLDTSRSKAAKELREKRDREDRVAKFKSESESMRMRIATCRRDMEQLRKEGMQLDGEQRVARFREAAELSHEAARLQKEITALAQKHGV